MDNQVTENSNISSSSKINNLPSAFKILDESLFQKRKPVIFLDFDGTLAPIVDDHSKAILNPEIKKVLISLCKKYTCAVLTGRDLLDIKNRVGIEDFIFAGSHGYDIKGPAFQMMYEKGMACLPFLDKAETDLIEALGSVTGSVVERKKFAIAVHYRNVDKEDVKVLLAKVKQVISQYECLKTGHGKMVVEVKPNIDWHKGRALEWLMTKLNLNKDEYVPVFIGDDITDEDGFKVIQNYGFGILVGKHNQPTFASYSLQSPEDVKEFLLKLI